MSKELFHIYDWRKCNTKTTYLLHREELQQWKHHVAVKICADL